MHELVGGTNVSWRDGLRRMVEAQPGLAVGPTPTGAPDGADDA
jgi:hypothetical protein